MKAKYIIGGVIIVLFLVWGASAFFKTTIRYVSIEEARRSGSMVQVMGKIDFDRVNYDAANSRLEFVVYDAQAADVANAQQLNVVYRGVVPGNFDQATSVVLKGKSEGDVFVAEQMLVKCPSKYQGEGGAEYQDMRKHDEGARQGGA
ncbi:MAG TPA: cytochrome c maturation protein CcmE [Candidatus Deferrimicrobium sp.]|nr:cytochrome c maturation protein CcmE [Candidatus Deferrimicrobium sp.]